MRRTGGQSRGAHPGDVVPGEPAAGGATPVGCCAGGLEGRLPRIDAEEEAPRRGELPRGTAAPRSRHIEEVAGHRAPRSREESTTLGAGEGRPRKMKHELLPCCSRLGERERHGCLGVPREGDACLLLPRVERKEGADAACRREGIRVEWICCCCFACGRRRAEEEEGVAGGGEENEGKRGEIQKMGREIRYL